MGIKIIPILLLCFASSSKAIHTPNKKLVIFAVTTERTDGYLLFLRSLRTYGLKLQKLYPTGQNYTGHAMKINIFNKQLEKYKDRSDVIVLFTDTYDVVFTAGEEDIISRFESFHSNVVFSAESNCSPIPSLASRYPEVENGYRYLNSGGFIGYASSVYDMLPPYNVTEELDDQLYYSLSYLDENIRTSIGITLDTQAVIFQSLHGAQDNVSVVFLEDDAKLQNHYTNTTPLIIHGNGNDGKLLLHTLSSYLAKSWTPSRGCLSCEERRMNLAELPIEEYPFVLMAVFIDQPTPFLEKKLNKVYELVYPKRRMYLFVSNKVVEHEDIVRRWVNGCQAEYAESKYISSLGSNFTIGGIRELAIKMCLNRVCDVLFNIDSEATIENPLLLRILISYRKTALAPVMTELGTSRSTFWGGITEELKYVESFDYMNIISNKRRGIWNVPQLFHIYVIWRYILENPFYDGGIASLPVHPDIAISHIVKITKNFSIFLYAINLEHYGSLSNMSHKSTGGHNKDLWQVRSNPTDWEDKYINQQFHEYLGKNISSQMICPDVFSFPLFSEKFTSEITKIIETKIRKFNKMTEKILYGVEKGDSSMTVFMGDIGFEEEWRHIIWEYIKPMVEKVFNGYHCKGEEKENFIIHHTNRNFHKVIGRGNRGTVALVVPFGTKENYFQEDEIEYLRYNCSVTSTPVGWVIVFPGRLTHNHVINNTTRGEKFILYSYLY